MNTVNIRIVPINRIHRGGLVIMSKKKTHDTGKKKTKRETVRIQDRGNRDTGDKERHFTTQKKSRKEERRYND